MTDDLSKKMLGVGSTVFSNNMSVDLTELTLPRITVPKSPAESMYDRLGRYIKCFENKLDDEHEIGARLVSFGQNITFHIEDVGYHGPDIISFDGITEDDNRVQLIQHISQLSVLLIAMKKASSSEPARRIGFIWDK